MSIEGAGVTGTESECAKSAGLPSARIWTRVLNIAIVLTLIGIGAAMLVASGRRSLLAGDETRYGTIIREMDERGEFSVLTLNGEAYSHKPPLHFWTIYALTRVFGIHSTWPYLIPSLGAFAILLLLVAVFMRGFCPNGWAVAVFIYATFFVTWGAGQIARMDAGFAMFVTAAILLLRDFLDSGRRNALLGAGLLTGLAILTKGPMAFVMVAALLLLERWRRREKLPPGPYGAAAAIAVAIPVAWLVLAAIHGGTQYIRELVITQNLGRAVASFAHDEPPWYYLTHAPEILFPWFFLFAFALWRALRKGGFRETPGFFVSWILAVFLPFSAISGKLEIYMLPLFVPVALLIAAFLVREESRGWRMATLISNLAITGIMMAIFAYALFAHPDAPSQQTARELLALPIVRDVMLASAIVAGVALVAIVVLGLRGAAVGTVVTAFAAIFPLAIMSSVLTPYLNGIVTTDAIVAAIAKQGVAVSEVAAVDMPFLWTKNAAHAQWVKVRYIDESELTPEAAPRVIVTRGEDLKHNDAFSKLLRTRYRLAGSVGLRGRPVYFFHRR